MQEGKIIKQTQPSVIEKICDSVTLKQIKECLIGVCKDSGATAFKLFKDTPYPVAGKTGTALVADGKRGYGASIYQSSFAGYFPADNPQYTVAVVIINKPHALYFMVLLLQALCLKKLQTGLLLLNAPLPDSLNMPQQNQTIALITAYAGFQSDLKSILSTINIAYTDSCKNSGWQKCISSRINLY